MRHSDVVVRYSDMTGGRDIGTNVAFLVPFLFFTTTALVTARPTLVIGFLAFLSGSQAVEDVCFAIEYLRFDRSADEHRCAQ